MTLFFVNDTILLKKNSFKREKSGIMNKKRLYKVEDGKKIAGVCGGVAEYLDIDPTFIRLGWAFTSLFFGSGLLIYIVAAAVMPKKSDVTVE